jgi:bacteriocin-like protein
MRARLRELHQLLLRERERAEKAERLTAVCQSIVRDQQTQRRLPVIQKFDLTAQKLSDLQSVRAKSCVELTEDELANVSGGLIHVRKAGENPVEYSKYS